LILEPLEDRQLLAGITPLSVLPTDQGTAASAIAYPVGPNPSVNDPTLHNAASPSSVQPASYQGYAAAAKTSGTGNQPSASAARQTYAAAAGAAIPYATNQEGAKTIGAPADSTNEAHERYPTTTVQLFPPPAESAPAATPQPALVPAPAVAQALPTGGTAESPPPPETGRPAALPVTVAHSRVKTDDADTGPVPEPPARASAQAFQGQAAGPLVAASEEQASGLFPQLGALLGGTVHIDLLTLERAADEFFARLDALADDLVAAPSRLNLGEWLLAAAVAAGALEFARRHGKPVDPRWLLPPLLAACPGEDVP
jgi:hypothetical protein